MTLRRLLWNSLRHHWRAHLGVVLGAAVGVAVLTGALLVGDSVRQTLRDRALERTAGAHHALHSGDRFFRPGLSTRLANSYYYLGQFGVLARGHYLDWFAAKPETMFSRNLLLHGVAARQDGAARANRVQILCAT